MPTRVRRGRSTLEGQRLRTTLREEREHVGAAWWRQGGPPLTSRHARMARAEGRSRVKVKVLVEGEEREVGQLPSTARAPRAADADVLCSRIPRTSTRVYHPSPELAVCGGAGTVTALATVPQRDVGGAGPRRRDALVRSRAWWTTGRDAIPGLRRRPELEPRARRLEALHFDAASFGGRGHGQGMEFAAESGRSVYERIWTSPLDSPPRGMTSTRREPAHGGGGPRTGGVRISREDGPRSRLLSSSAPRPHFGVG